MRTSSEKIKATLETTGNVFSIEGTANRYTFTSGAYNLNYNDSRRLINGYEGNLAEFFIYKLAEYKVKVVDGTAKNEYGTVIEEAYKKDKITLTAAKAPEGKEFDKWIVVSGDVKLSDEESEEATFIMPGEAIEIKAIYKDVEK